MAMMQQSNAQKAKRVNKFSIGTTEEDNYITPRYAWEYIKNIIPHNRIYEPFYCDGQSGKILKDMGYIVYHKNEDFFKNAPKTNKPYTIVTNPPYSILKEVLVELKKRDRPFILLITAGKISSKYIRKVFKNGELGILYPPERINFVNEKTMKIAHIPDAIYLTYKIPKVQGGSWGWLEEAKEIKTMREEHYKKYKPKPKKHTCSCGCVFNLTSLKSHLKTKKHKKLLAEKETTLMLREDKEGQGQ